MTVLLAEATPEKLWTDIVAVRPYYPYSGSHFRKIEDGSLLDLKDNLDRGVMLAVKEFRSALVALGLPPRGGSVRLVVVPGHEARPTNVGRALSRVVAQLASASDGGYVDGSDVLLRHTTIDKLALGGDRSERVHLSSICVAAPILPREELVVLDDVTTSGGSQRACRQLLLEAGASAVGALVLGVTTH